MSSISPAERLRAFIASESAGGIILIVAAALALAIANSPLLPDYQKLLSTPVAFSAGSLVAIDKPLLLWINDGLMALFFFLIGLEVKREIVTGQLRSWKQASLPIIAAIGGMAIPAIVFVALNLRRMVAQAQALEILPRNAAAIIRDLHVLAAALPEVEFDPCGAGV